MRYMVAALATLGLINAAAAQPAEPPATQCPAPPALISSETELPQAIKAIKENRPLVITVVGTGSSALPGPEGARFAYPARLEDALRRRLPGNDVRVIVHIQSRQTTAQMAAGLKKILADDKPVLVIWQAGTFDALSGIEPDVFSASLDQGVEGIIAAGADVDLMNMQYSPRTAALLSVSAYAEVMRWVAQQRGALLFDRLAIMRSWNEEGIFDLYAPTKKYDMARRVHDCIGRALASQILNAAHMDAVRMQITR